MNCIASVFNKTFILLFFCSCHTSFVAQDSLQKAYYKAKTFHEKLKTGIAYLEELRFEDPDKALKICDSLLVIEKENKSTFYTGFIYEHAGGASWQKGDLKTSTNFYKQSYFYHTKANNQEEAAASLNNMAYNYFEAGDYTTALKHLSHAQQIGKQLNNPEVLSITNTYLGQVNIKLKQYARGIEAYKQSLVYFENEKRFKNQAIIYNNIGNAYLEQNIHDSALYWFDRSHKLSEEKGNQNGIALALSNKGLTYIEQRKFDSAEKALLTAYNKYDSLNNGLSIVLVCSNLVRLYTETNKTDEAIIYAQRAELLATEVGSFEQLVNVYNSLSNLYAKKGDYNKAFNYSKLQLRFTDSLTNENTQRIQNEMATKFETDGLNDRIALLNNTNKLKDAEIEKKKARQNLYLSLTAAALIITGMLLYLLFTKNKTQKKLESKNKIIEKSLKEREVLLKEIHHRVKNNLQIISSLLSLQGGYGNSITAEELIRQSESRIKSMALIHEKLYQSENLKEINLQDYIGSFMEQLAIILLFDERKITYVLDVEEMNLDIDKLVPLGLIFNELITNAVKHAFKNKESGVINITGTRGKEAYVVVIDDNGEGMPSDFSVEKSKTLGMRLIKGLANQIKATLNIESKKGKTSFFISLPLN